MPSVANDKCSAAFKEMPRSYIPCIYLKVISRFRRLFRFFWLVKFHCRDGLDFIGLLWYFLRFTLSCLDFIVISIVTQYCLEFQTYDLYLPGSSRLFAAQHEFLRFIFMKLRKCSEAVLVPYSIKMSHTSSKKDLFPTNSRKQE